MNYIYKVTIYDENNKDLDFEYYQSRKKAIKIAKKWDKAKNDKDEMICVFEIPVTINKDGEYEMYYYQQVMIY